MTLWRYIAVPSEQTGMRRRGELVGATEAEVRAALRRLGLQVVDIWPARGRVLSQFKGPVGTVTGGLGSIIDAAQRRARRRRRAVRAQLHDSLGTMVRSGIPLLEAVETLAGGTQSGRPGDGARRTMLIELREALRGGASLASAMRSHPGWFDPVEAAMVEAGQHAGTLPEVLEAIAERHEQDGRLAQRLAAAMLYPSIVAVAAVAVTVFLSVRTLPELVQILESAKVEPPALTVWVMWAGRIVAGWGWIAALGAGAAAILGVPILAMVKQSGLRSPRFEVPTPRVLRAIAVADLSMRLGELVRSGVPVTEALRVLAPSTRRSLSWRLVDAAERVERGEELAAALRQAGGGKAGGGREGSGWFDEEYLRLVEVAQTSGELDSMLDRVGRRYEREARRSIDRLATLLEPAVIVLLAALVGTVVMAAVLPLARMKDAI